MLFLQECAEVRSVRPRCICTWARFPFPSPYWPVHFSPNMSLNFPPSVLALHDHLHPSPNILSVTQLTVESLLRSEGPISCICTTITLD
jgi:hypothetical protein